MGASTLLCCWWGGRLISPQRVQVFLLRSVNRGKSKGSLRYQVRWRVDGRDRTRSFRVKAQAERLRSELLVELGKGTLFDVASVSLFLGCGRMRRGGRGLGSGWS